MTKHQLSACQQLRNEVTKKVQALPPGRRLFSADTLWFVDEFIAKQASERARKQKASKHE